MLNVLSLLTLWRDKRGQDLVEYALLAGFVAVATGIVVPYGFAVSVSTIFSRLQVLLTNVGHAG